MSALIHRTPTESTHTSGPIGLFRRLIRRDQPESTKRAQLIWATWALIIVAVSLGLSIAGRIALVGDVGSGAVASFLAATGPLAALAGASYRKADTTSPAPPGGKP